MVRRSSSTRRWRTPCRPRTASALPPGMASVPMARRRTAVGLGRVQGHGRRATQPGQGWRTPGGGLRRGAAAALSGMTRDMYGNALVPGYNVDLINVKAGLKELVACGYDDDARRFMVIEHALMRWQRGEEEAAERGAIDRAFHGIDFTSWPRVLAAAMAHAHNIEKEVMAE